MSRAVSLALSVCLLGSTAVAQGDAVMELYGEGVHRYFAGDLIAANELLSRVVDSGSQDPRAYYFRGLVQELQGVDGQADFEHGAKLEAEGRLSVPVGLALIRIQGMSRAKIEVARRDARVVYLQERAKLEQARVEAAVNAAREAAASKATTDAVASQPSDAVADNFVPGELRSEDTTVDSQQPSTPEADAITNPFADDSAPQAATQTPATEAAPSTVDPFGGAAGADDPFGGAAGGNDPFGGNAGGSSNDPFGAGTGSTENADPFGQ